jgi:hypothetical protein
MWKRYNRPDIWTQAILSEHCPTACEERAVHIWMNQGAFLMKGLDNVRAEFSLTALVYNLRRALNILGVEAMMAAVRG